MHLSLHSLRRPSWLVLGVIGVFLAAEIAARLVLTTAPDAIRWYDASTQLKIEQMDDLDNVDVVFAGTSMAWQAFVPDSFDPIAGTTSYNAGLNGGTPEVMERWLLEEVVPRVHPTTVVWGLSSLDLAPNYGPQQREVYDDALATKTGILADVEQAAARWSALVANRSVLRSLNDLWGNGADLRDADFTDAEDRLGVGGERLDFRINRGDRQRQIIQARLREFDPHTADIETITAVVAELERRGIEVVLVQLPVPLSFVEAHPNSTDDYGRVGITLDAIATANDLRFLDMTDDFEGIGFVDYTHLDRDSAARFSELAAEAFSSARDDRGTASFTPANPAPVGDSGGADCRTEVLVDEYGFEIETLVCEADDEDTTPSNESVEADAAAFEQLVAAFLQRSCADPVPQTSLPSAVDVQTRQALEAALGLLAEASASCGTDRHDLLWSSAVDELARSTGIERRGGNEPSPVDTMSRSIAAIDMLQTQILDTPALSGSEAWHHADELLASLELRRRSVADAIDVVAIGSSETIHAVSQVELDEHFDGRFLNIAVAGSDPEEWHTLWRRIFNDTPLPSRVLWGVTTHRMLDPEGTDCSSLVAGGIRRSEAYRAALFPDYRDAYDIDQILFGTDLDETPAVDGPSYQAGAPRYRSPGDRIPLTSPFRGIPQGERRYPDPIYCSERIEVWREIVQEIEASASTVQFVLLPLHPDVVAEAPELHARAREELLRFAAEVGVEIIEIDTPYGDDETTDGWHANGRGRERVTADLLDALTRPG